MPLSTRFTYVFACLALIPVCGVSMADEVDLPRYPAISPDGSFITFSWRGDIWLADRDGGEARRLTTHPGVDSRSAWSPDGDLIAFESDRDGYRNIWVVEPDGGGIRQVVQTDRYAILSDFSSGPAEAGGPDAPTITFDGRHEGDLYRASRPYEVSVDGGPFERVHDAFGTAAARSADGSRVLFERGGSSWTRRHYRGPDSRDVWMYSPDEGFTQLTTWEGNDGQPQWIDDDTMIFMSDRELDAVNLYTQPIVPGVEAAQRLTDFDDHDITAFDVSADGKVAVFQNWDTLYSLDLTNPNAKPIAIEMTANVDGLERVVPRDVSRRVTEAALSPDGKTMAVVAYGDVWVRNVDSKSPTRRVTKTLAHDRGIAWSPDGLKLYFVSDEDGTEAIYAATVERTREEIRDAWKEATAPPESEDADSEEEDGAKDDTDKEAPTKKADKEKPKEAGGETSSGGLGGAWLATVTLPDVGAVEMTFDFKPADDGMWQFTFTSDLYNGSGTGSFDEETGEFELDLQVDNGPLVVVTGRIDGDSLTGTTDAASGSIPIRGTRVVADEPADAEETKKEDEAEEEEDDPTLDPTRWHDAIDFVIEPVINSGMNDSGVSPSPDGTKLAFRRGLGEIMVYDIETGEESVVRSGWDASSEFVWAPDSQGMAIAASDRNFNSDVWFVPLDDPSGAVNISRHPDNDRNPSFSEDGRVLAFISERKDEEYDVFAVYLDKTLEGLHEPELEEYYSEAGKAAKKRKPLPVRKPGAKPPKPVERDWEPSYDDAYLRLQRLSTLPGNERGVMLTPAGDKLIYSHSGGAPGDSGIWSVKWDGSGAKRIGSGSPQHLSLTGDKIITVSGGAGWLPIAGGTTKSIPIDAEIDIDLAEQSSRKFTEAARIFGAFFYHPEMKGFDWEELTDSYHDLAQRAWTGDEFNWVAARLLGELNASHTGIRSPGYSASNSEAQGRLGIRHQPVDGGFEVLEVIDGSPAAIGPMPLMQGDVITSVDGAEVSEADRLETLLRGKIGEEVIIGLRREMVNEDDETTEMELEAIIEPISSGRRTALLYDQFQRHSQELVDELSDGRIGYLHVQSMNQSSLDEFERDLFAVADGREGLIIDVRNNGGGWTADRLLASIDSRPHAYTVPRGADPEMRTGYPQDRLFIQRYVLPINMLCNEKSFSNAEIVSHAFKTLGRGTLVGEQTYGGVISTGGTSLVDGTSIRLPFRGWYLLDGTDMENNGAIPDIRIKQTPEDESANRDAQLRAAIADLVERLPEPVMSQDQEQDQE